LQEALSKKINNTTLIAGAASKEADADENMVALISREVNILNVKKRTIIVDLFDISRNFTIHIGR
jgi:hypothetical protein